jgi:hypothetical protein
MLHRGLLVLVGFAAVLLSPSLALAATSGAPASSWLLGVGLGLLVALLLGSGIVPAGAVGAELNSITRRAFIPKCIVQIYAATPVLAAGLANAQTASGGVSSITVPVQGSPFVTAQATDYSGLFTQPAVQQGITDADFNLKAVVVPIPFLGMEGIVQMNAAVIPLLEARMNDAGNQIAAYLSTQLWTNNVANSINIDGWPLIAATNNTYGNIDRTIAANAFWQANVRAGQANTRIGVLTNIVSAARAAGGEMPNMGVMSPGTWVQLAGDFVAQENYRVTPGTGFDEGTQGVRGAFTALSVGGVPIYIDPLCVDGQLLLFNTRYASFYIHEAAAFAFTGFASTLPNMQLGYVGALVVVLEYVVVKPSTVTLATGLGSVSGV